MIGVYKGFSAESLEVLKKLNLPVVLCDETPENPRVQYLAIRSRTVVDELLLNKLPHLKFVVTATSGYDHIDLKLCLQRGIQVCHTPLAAVESVAELTFMHALNLCRDYPRALANVSSGLFRKNLPKGELLADKAWGIVGHGRIGKRVEQIARLFCREVFIFDPYTIENGPSLEDLLERADIVSLHVPLTSATRGMIGQSAFQRMKRGSFLINVSRGPVVNQGDLHEALRSGQISGAGLDVFETEPPEKDLSFFTCPRTTATPHIGSHVDLVHLRSSLQAVESLSRFLNNQEVAHPLPETAAWAQQE